MAIDVAIAIDAEAVDVTYYPVAAAGGAYNQAGVWVPGGVSGSTIRAAIQPASGRILQELPEGVRTDARFTGWSRTAVREADEIGYASERWRIIYVWPRPADGFTRFAMGKTRS